MSVKPTNRRLVTITDHGATTTSKGPSQVSNAPSAQKDLHPLPPVHFDPGDPAQKKMLDLWESVVKRTDAMAKNPLTAPAYERRIAFNNPGSNAAAITVTFQHSLGRAPTNGVTCIHSEGAAYSGYSVPNPQGQDPAQFQTVTANVPGKTTAYHSFMLHAD